MDTATLKETFIALLHQTIREPYSYVFVGGVLLLFYSLHCIRSRRKVIYLFDSASGQITVSRGAILSLIQKICIDMGVYKVPKICVKTKDNRLYLKIKLKLFSHQKLGNLSLSVQDKIEATLRDNLGMEGSGKIDIQVTGFVNQRSVSSGAKTTKIEWVARRDWLNTDPATLQLLDLAKG